MFSLQLKIRCQKLQCIMKSLTRMSMKEELDWRKHLSIPVLSTSSFTNRHVLAFKTSSKHFWNPPPTHTLLYPLIWCHSLSELDRSVLCCCVCPLTPFPHTPSHTLISHCFQTRLIALCKHISNMQVTVRRNIAR